MKRLMIIFLLFVPFGAIGADLDIRNQMLDSEIEKLTMQRDEKYAALQKCEKNTKGFKIAGLTTLVATGIGIYGNIKLSQKLKGTSWVRRNSSVETDNRSEEEKADYECQNFCKDDAEFATSIGCNC